MPTYSAAAVSDTVIAHKQGITIQQGRALRDNPIAMAEGQSGAPRFARKVIYTTTRSNALSGIAGYDGCKVEYSINIPPPDGTVVTIQFSNDGTTWPASLTLGTSAIDGIELYGTVYVDFSDGAYINIPRDTLTVSAGTIADMPEAPTHIRFHTSAATGSGRIVVIPDGGTAAS